MIEGWYYDPLHGNCLRRIKRLGVRQYRIWGVYGSDEPHTGDRWYATATATPRGREEYDLIVDFSGKPIKKKKNSKGTIRESIHSLGRW